jgi:hypothetical protein
MATAEDEATIEGLKAWVLQESPTYAAAGVNAMMDLVEAEVRDARSGSSACPASRGWATPSCSGPGATPASPESS